MFRKRRAPDYTGRHRIKAKNSGGHRQDRLPPPDEPDGQDKPPRTDLLSDEPEGSWSRWYDPSKLRGIDPDLISSVPPEFHHEPPTQALPPWMEPKRKIQPRYITAAIVTALLAVPTLIMAGYIANENSTDSMTTNATISATANLSGATTSASRIRPSPSSTVRVPIVLLVNGERYPICITLKSTGPGWTASTRPLGC